MSVPLERLYRYLESICNHDVLIYRFYPHGSKKLENLAQLSPGAWIDSYNRPLMICHDQEPLNYDFYQTKSLEWSESNETSWLIRSATSKLNLRTPTIPLNGFDKTLLVHSELNSKELEKYEQNNFVGIHWWVHGVIARDWYRYAEYDPELKFKFENIKKDFLIYNRSWSGTREYRLKFIELVLNNQLQNFCRITFNPVDSGLHYRSHNFKNQKLSSRRFDIENFFDKSRAGSDSSGDYDNSDYSSTAIEVVLETLFDDSRHHLTEKILRPIACGKPFILISTPGALKYLHRYGIRTFNGLIDESYDLISDPKKRLEFIVKEMSRLANLPIDQKKTLWSELNQIAKFNKELFFSDSWLKNLTNEFINNYNQARHSIQNFKGNIYLSVQNNYKSDPVLVDLINPDGSTNAGRTKEEYENFLKFLKSQIPFTPIDQV
jgi:hypothetical protein